jgi:hypothetical protein
MGLLGGRQKLIASSAPRSFRRRRGGGVSDLSAGCHRGAGWRGGPTLAISFDAGGVEVDAAVPVDGPAGERDQQVQDGDGGVDAAGEPGGLHQGGSVVPGCRGVCIRWVMRPTATAAVARPMKPPVVIWVSRWRMWAVVPQSRLTTVAKPQLTTHDPRWHSTGLGWSSPRRTRTAPGTFIAFGTATLRHTKGATQRSDLRTDSHTAAGNRSLLVAMPCHTRRQLRPIAELP